MVPILAALHSYTLHPYTSPGPNLPLLLAVILNHHHLPILEKIRHKYLLLTSSYKKILANRY